MSDRRPLRTEKEYESALARVFELMDGLPERAEGMNGSEEAEFERLVALIERYEDEHYPIEDPSPVGAIEFRMDQEGLSPQDLVPMIGSRTQVDEVLSGKRAITPAMARALHARLGIPIEVLLNKEVTSAEPEIAASSRACRTADS